MTFCHTEKQLNGEIKFVMNYLHWDFVHGYLERRCAPAHVEKIKNFYAKLYEGQNMIGQLAGAQLKMALQNCNLYPEKESKYKISPFNNVGYKPAQLGGVFGLTRTPQAKFFVLK